MIARRLCGAASCIKLSPGEDENGLVRVKLT
jgi:hypothetical protein